MVIGMAVAILLAGTNVRASVPGLVMQAGPFAKFVLAVLLLMSVWSWAVIWNRLTLYGRVLRADRAFLIAYRRRANGMTGSAWADQYPDSLLAFVAAAGMRASEPRPASPAVPASPGQIQRTMERVANDQISRLEKHVGFLATTGSVAPFIGLMGTVWGVMSAFLNIGAQGSATLVVVAPGIAEALIATVAGLGTAIPSVVAYNHILGRLREFTSGTAAFITEFLDRRTAPEATT